MASFADNRQNVSIAQLLEWADTNPNKSSTLTPIGIPDEASVMRKQDKQSAKETATLESIGLGEFESITMTPTGILSAIAWMSDPTYRYMTSRSRLAYLRDMATRLQQQTDTLAGGPMARKRRKLYDGIGALANTGAVKPADHFDLFSGLCAMLSLQVIFVKLATVVEDVGKSYVEGADEDSDSEGADAEKRIFFSSNPASWTPTAKTYIVDYFGRWIASPLGERSMGSVLYWMEDLQIHGWVVDWHIDATLTKDALVTRLSAMRDWQPEHTRLLKAVLAERLAKHLAIDAMEAIARSA
jgi:hypothetical protein